MEVVAPLPALLAELQPTANAIKVKIKMRFISISLFLSLLGCEVRELRD
jgi:hypothetical protein